MRTSGIPKNTSESLHVVSKIIDESVLQRAAEQYVPRNMVAKDSIRKTIDFADSLAFICNFSQN